MSTSPADRRSLVGPDGNHGERLRKDSTAIDLSANPLPHGFDPIDFEGARDSDPSPNLSSPNLSSPNLSSPNLSSPNISSPTASTGTFPIPEGAVQGLGILNRPMSIERKPVGSLSPPTPSNPFRSPSTRDFNAPRPAPNPSSKPVASPSISAFNSPNIGTPGSSRPLLSPESSYLNNTGAFTPAAELDDGDISRGTTKFAQGLDLAFGEINEPQIRPQSVHGDIDENRDGDIDENRGPAPQHTRQVSFPEDNMTSDMRSFHGSMTDNDQKSLIDGCPTKHDIHRKRASWLSISIIMLSVYSSVFSGIWLLLALIQPRYGRVIHSLGSFTPATASIVFALFAKTIELSFVTVFVSFLGQVLSRRSLIKASRGVTIAELSMRTWVIQPGFMITHWEHIAHAGATFLGIVSLIAALVAMFYTTASDALVSPHLRFGRWENKVMHGLVKTSYANPTYISDTCQTPITLSMDPVNAGVTCLAIMHAGQAYHSSIAFLGTWTDISEAGEGVSSDIALRPPPPSMLYDNTTVVGSWVATNTSNMTAAYEKYNRIINNVTVSMPHSGVYQAARDSKNGILQPEELDGVGEYAIRASVVSPSLNVLCVNLNKTELAPLVYVTWPNATLANSTTNPGRIVAWSGYQSEIQLANSTSYLNRTVVDDIFEWGAKYSRQPPIFPEYPIDFNSITNISVPGSDSVYMLIKADSASTADYTMCQMRSFLAPFCSTYYNVSGVSAGHMSSTCEDPNDKMRYDKSVPGAPVFRSGDWRNVGSEWLLALSLNTGISDANSSTSRLLAQMIPTVPGWGSVQLNPLMPSIAETLAVMAGNTLLMSAQDATFYHYWQYSATILVPGAELPFNASVSSQQYTSGLTQKWQGVFYIVLILVFATNLFCLIYYIARSGLVTDYTEPQNLFALAVNSPPSESLSGSCGAGPEGDQLNVDWHVTHEDESGHFFIREGTWDEKQKQEEGVEMRRRSGRTNGGVEAAGGLLGSGNSRARDSYTVLSSKRRSWL